MIDPRTVDLARLNSATKYPSIETYHALGEKGRLTPTVQVDFTGQRVFLSEKVDGTNARIIVWPDHKCLVGSRNDLLWFSDDLIHNPSQGIVDIVKPVLGTFGQPAQGFLRVYFLEAYGGNTGNGAKQYSRSGLTGFRLFDIVEFDQAMLAETLKMEPDGISMWREKGGQPFVPTSDLGMFGLPLTPHIEVESPPPADLAGTLTWLEGLLPETRCKLDETGIGQGEGIVLRTNDRKLIAKARFEDYRRTIKR
jgi:hypothetical protein